MDLYNKQIRIHTYIQQSEALMPSSQWLFSNIQSVSLTCPPSGRPSSHGHPRVPVLRGGAMRSFSPLRCLKRPSCSRPGPNGCACGRPRPVAAALVSCALKRRRRGRGRDGRFRGVAGCGGRARGQGYSCGPRDPVEARWGSLGAVLNPRTQRTGRPDLCLCLVHGHDLDPGHHPQHGRSWLKRMEAPWSGWHCLFLKTDTQAHRHRYITR